MKCAMFLFLTLLLPVLAFAQAEEPILKYNPFDNNWQWTNPQAELQYNPHTNTWDFTASGQFLQYNPHSGSWEWGSEKAGLQYNPHSNQWSVEEPGSELKYNPFENKWQYAPQESQLSYNPFTGKWEYPSPGGRSAAQLLRELNGLDTSKLVDWFNKLTNRELETLKNALEHNK